MPPTRPQESDTPDRAAANPEKTWFGDISVSAAEKTEKVLGVFHSVASKYDIMNDAMSGGLHRYWKNRLVRQIRPRATDRILDLAGGTGDIAFRMSDATGRKADITVCDINPSMLSVGRDRAFDKGFGASINFITGNAESLPFPDAHFDIVTIAFGLRNVTHIDTALKDIRRVLKPGGRFYCLEFSQVNDPLLRKIYALYSDIAIPRLGQMIAGDRDSYAYLVESIRRFPKRKALETRMKHAGFDRRRCGNSHRNRVVRH
jgi:demethylmenaquinone methyltransferase/2-methoxy-6-polyprenyl-1,4-benzoquinol methylase